MIAGTELVKQELGKSSPNVSNKEVCLCLYHPHSLSTCKLLSRVFTDTVAKTTTELLLTVQDI